jgi:hypothetical protein
MIIIVMIIGMISLKFWVKPPPSGGLEPGNEGGGVYTEIGNHKHLRNQRGFTTKFTHDIHVPDFRGGACGDTEGGGDLP